MADSIKIPIDADTSKGIAGVQTMRKEVEKTTESGAKLTGGMTAGFKDIGKEALSVVGALTGVSLSISGIVSLIQSFAQYQREIIQNQAQAIQQEQDRINKRAASLTGPLQQRGQAELGMSIAQQDAAAKEWARQTGQKAEDWTAAALEAGKGQLGEMQAFGRFATATGIRAENVPDMLELGMGAKTPEARAAAMGRIAGVVKAGGIESTDQVALALQNFGAQIRQYWGDPLPIIAALSKRFGAKKMMGYASQLAQGDWPPELDREFSQFKREAEQAAAGGTPATVEEMYGKYAANPEAKTAAANVERREEVGAPGSALEATQISQRARESVRQGISRNDVASLQSKRAIGDEGDAQRLAELIKLYEMYEPMLAAYAGNPNDGFRNIDQQRAGSLLEEYRRSYQSVGWGSVSKAEIDYFGVVTNQVIMFLRSAQKDRLIGAPESIPGQASEGSGGGFFGRAMRGELGAAPAAGGAQVSIGVYFGRTPNALAGNDSTRLG